MSASRSAAYQMADFFKITVPRPLVVEIIDARRVSSGVKSVILATSPDWTPVDDLPVQTRTIAYPDSVGVLMHLLLEEMDGRDQHDLVDVLIPKAILTALVDQVGCDRLPDVRFAIGMASADPIMRALQECFDGLRALGSSEADEMAERMIEVLNMHLVEQYGGVQKPTGVEGGLAPWQLRLAWRALNDVATSTGLSEIAEHCGLSTGHFARAFKRSTGVSPHQWSIQRRIEAAKEMLSAGVALAEIALACRFSDQSHLTRAFSQATGKTPGRWRAEQGLAHVH